MTTRMWSRVGAAAVVLAVVAWGTNRASAITSVPLVYEDGPDIGQTYTGGPVVFKMTNYDTGALYPTLATGTGAGYSGAPGAGVGGGVATLAGLATSPALNAYPGVQYPAYNESSWGIAQVTSIEDQNGYILWSPGVAGQQLTVLFSGEQDFHVQQINGQQQVIDGVGLNLAIYESPILNFDPMLGTAGRTGANAYTTVTQGTEILSINSAPGFINGDGVNGGLATEFESTYNYPTNSGLGLAFGDVDPTSLDASEFDTGTFTSAFGYPNADIEIQWTDSGVGSVADWLVKSQDPVSGSAFIAAVPEPVTATMGGVSLVVLGCFSALRRRAATSA